MLARVHSRAPAGHDAGNRRGSACDFPSKNVALATSWRIAVITGIFLGKQAQQAIGPARLPEPIRIRLESANLAHFPICPTSAPACPAASAVHSLRSRLSCAGASGDWPGICCVLADVVQKNTALSVVGAAARINFRRSQSDSGEKRQNTRGHSGSSLDAVQDELARESGSSNRPVLLWLIRIRRASNKARSCRSGLGHVRSPKG